MWNSSIQDRKYLKYKKFIVFQNSWLFSIQLTLKIIVQIIVYLIALFMYK